MADEHGRRDVERIERVNEVAGGLQRTVLSEDAQPDGRHLDAVGILTFELIPIGPLRPIAALLEAAGAVRPSLERETGSDWIVEMSAW